MVISELDLLKKSIVSINETADEQESEEES
jgi:hypothetical protein